MGFKFEIGDMVVINASVELMKLRRAMSEKLAYPIIAQIIERHAIECPGGIQCYYLIRPWLRPWLQGAEGQFIKINEIEASAWDIDAWLKEHGDKEAQEEKGVSHEL
jgi:hypothetical protein